MLDLHESWQSLDPNIQEFARSWRLSVCVPANLEETDGAVDEVAFPVVDDLVPPEEVTEQPVSEMTVLGTLCCEFGSLLGAVLPVRQTSASSIFTGNGAFWWLESDDGVDCNNDETLETDLDQSDKLLLVIYGRRCALWKLFELCSQLAMFEKLRPNL